MNQKEVISHFNTISPHYDKYKIAKPYYYGAILKGLDKYISRDVSVLDFGCATGTILRALKCKRGVGYDPSKRMVQIAQKKYHSVRHLIFTNNLKSIKGEFDRILVIDVIEHLANFKSTIKLLKKLCKPKTLVLVSHVNSRWEPLLIILEKLRLKMPEGPHKRITDNELIKRFGEFNFVVKKVERLPIFSWSPGIRPITLVVFQRKSD